MKNYRGERNFQVPEIRGMFEKAVRDCVTIESLAQVVLSIVEAGQYDTISDYTDNGRVREALRLINRTTGYQL